MCCNTVAVMRESSRPQQVSHRTIENINPIAMKLKSSHHPILVGDLNPQFPDNKDYFIVIISAAPLQ
jgi:hypothetical protein